MAQIHPAKLCDWWTAALQIVSPKIIFNARNIWMDFTTSACLLHETCSPLNAPLCCFTSGSSSCQMLGTNQIKGLYLCKHFNGSNAQKKESKFIETGVDSLNKVALTLSIRAPNKINGRNKHIHYVAPSGLYNPALKNQTLSFSASYFTTKKSSCCQLQPLHNLKVSHRSASYEAIIHNFQLNLF